MKKTLAKMKFTGELAKPIVRRSERSLRGMEAVIRASGLPSPGLCLEEDRRVERERCTKFELLAKKIGISADTPRDSPEYWKTIAISLAEAYVPGFQITEGLPRGRGRPNKRAVEGIELLEGAMRESWRRPED